MFASNTSAANGAANYIEDVFSTYLYTGNGSTQTITNSIDLAGKGGMVWIKQRNQPTSHRLFDTARGVQNSLASNSTAGTASFSGYLTAFNSNGFDVGSANDVNESGFPLASWTFRKQPKFFDVVTYTGNGVLGRQISHNLGSAPGFMVVKRTDAGSTGQWRCYHQSMGAAYTVNLNTTDAKFMASDWVNGSLDPTAPTSTVFTVSDGYSVNANGGTYVAYLFAHNAGGFGLTGTDNVISCGSYTGVSSGTLDINLGYETQWVLIKKATANNGVNRDWLVVDTMRGMPVLTNYANGLYPNTSGIETVNNDGVHPSPTGFYLDGGFDRVCNSGETFIYIAIRRGPMKVPTSGTSVFSPISQNAGSNTIFTTGFPVDLVIDSSRSGSNHYVLDRLRGSSTTASKSLFTDSTSAESSNPGGFGLDSNTTTNDQITQFTSEITWNFRRAPSFFDEVCYTGTGVAGATFNHNLGVAPEMMIVKGRDSAYNWSVYHTGLTSAGYVIALNANEAQYANNNAWNSTAPTSTVFSVGGSGSITNTSAKTYVAYLFATAAGVSKVGKYTGTGATQTIACGFTGGARFVLIKRIDGAEFTPNGDWYVWDTARGMVSGTDPSLLLNSTAAEVNANSIYTTTGGFQIVSTAAGINASGGTYIYLAIA